MNTEIGMRRPRLGTLPGRDVALTFLGPVATDHGGGWRRGTAALRLGSDDGALMNNMLDPSHLTLHQVRAILQGMARVAHADGDDEREILLMQEFWEACSEEARQHTSLAHARSTPFDATAARAALSIAPLQQTFLAACLLVAYSDGKVSGAEQATIASLIDEVRIDDELVAETHARIKDLLLKRLEQVSDLEMLRKIGSAL